MLVRVYFQTILNTVRVLDNLKILLDLSAVQFRSLVLDLPINLKLGGITVNGPQCGHQ